ncbi:pectinesterase family protein [Chishuiella sp.]|uniref:pectinesterase family protein n=1 Tax=Chishuiella sp. TaxID=1969467 RepID=UPI0028AD8E77|nr:pectinesterase family protein [Chishuiella sp.]
MKTFFITLTIFFLNVYSFGQNIPAFPSAEGFGRYSSGGRGGEIYIVTNLNDSGEGSLRKGITKKESRTIVFAISGTIFLKSPLDINHGNLTILGQTAPGDGITVANYPVTLKSNNIILRYLRFRLGDLVKVEGDALGGRNIENIMIDHCSMSWATDENMSFYRVKNLTVQWSIIAEALNKSVHQKGAHGYGGIWGGEPASFHHNLIMSNNSRNPRFSGSESTVNPEDEMVDFRNNVIFNWGDNNIYGGEKGKYNIINNYFKSGTISKHKDRIINPSIPYGQFYVNGNFIEGYPKITTNNWDGGVQTENPLLAKAKEEFGKNEIKTHTAQETLQLVTKYAGASLKRDEVDNRLINYLTNGYPKNISGIINSQNEVGGFPILNSKITNIDSDKDGLPDDWEKANNLKIGIKNGSNFDLSSQYSNIEVYAESILDQINQGKANRNDYDFTVAKDGTGDFLTIQDLVLQLPDYSKTPIKVFIKNGIYKEKIILPTSKTNITFIGEDKTKTILTYDDYASKLNNVGQEIGTSGSASFFIFGDNFTAENITFQNTAGRVGQAVAIRTEADKIKFINCNFIGDQDTVYLVKPGSRQYFYNCYIEGTVDYIFGAATAYFDNCELHNKGKGYVTAASTTEEIPYGYIFYQCKITGEDANSHYLGRPWRPYAKVIFINTTMDESITHDGWNNWGKTSNESTTYFAEYNSTGKGASKNRINWSKQLNEKDIEYYSKDKVLGDWKF